jgi:hypothetical protein
LTDLTGLDNDILALIICNDKKKGDPIRAEGRRLLGQTATASTQDVRATLDNSVPNFAGTLPDRDALW